MSLALPITLTFNKRQVGDVLEKIMQVDTLQRGVTVMLRVPSGSAVTVSFPNERSPKGAGGQRWTDRGAGCRPAAMGPEPRARPTLQ